jgi:hypothetical protein
MGADYGGASPPLLDAETRKEAKWDTGIKRIDRLLNNLEHGRSTPLQHRKRAIWMLGLYVALVVVPWILTCFLAKRPIGASSYILQKGFTDSQVRGFRNWKTAIDVLNSIAGLVTIPFLSLVLAQAAVVFSQRQREDQLLGLDDLFALSDRGWTNFRVVWGSIWRRRSHKAAGSKWSGAFFLPAAGLIFLGALQQPLYQILVPLDTIAVTTCMDTKYQYLAKGAEHCKDQKSWEATYKPIGIDIEPSQMTFIYYNKFLRRLTSDLASISLDEEQPNLWSDWMSRRIWSSAKSSVFDTLGTSYRSLRPWLPSYSFDSQGPIPTFFVAGLQANSTTGVLREHVLRLNTSIHCTNISRESFPSPCPGETPFAVSLRRTNETEIRVCVPGKIGIFPWTLSRSRQDITEELYLDIRDDTTRGNPNEEVVSATLKCEATTTRGYFELGNKFNNDSYGPLLERWPAPEQMELEFNDWVPHESLGSGAIPQEE